MRCLYIHIKRQCPTRSGIRVLEYWSIDKAGSGETRCATPGHYIRTDWLPLAAAKTPALRRLIFRAAFCFCDFLRFGRPDVPCGRRYPLSRTRNTTQKSGALCPASACFLYYRRCPPLRGLPVARRTFPARERQGKRAARKAPPCKFSGSLFLRSFQRSTAAALCAARGRRRCAAARKSPPYPAHRSGRGPARPAGPGPPCQG